jgi:hypothetical protein
MVDTPVEISIEYLINVHYYCFFFRVGDDTGTFMWNFYLGLPGFCRYRYFQRCEFPAIG